MFEKIRAKVFTETNKNSLVLLYGTVLSQALPLLFSPVLARLYTPAQFGAFSLFFGIVAILGNISAGKLDFALYTARSKQNAIITALSGLTFTIIFSSLVLLFCLGMIIFSSHEILSVNAIVCIPFTVFFLGGSNVLVALSNREKKFRQISRAKILLGAIWVLVNIIFGLISPNAIGLILGYCLGQLVSVWYLLYVNRKDIFSIGYNLRIFKFNIIRNKNYALIFLPAHLLNTASASAPSLFLSYLFGLSANGLFFKASRIGESPTSIIRSSLGNVFWQQASHDFITTGNARKTMMRFLPKLLTLGLPGFLILFLFAEELFLFLFGPPWLEAAVYFKILAPYFFIQFIITPVAIMVVLANKPWVDITWQIFYALCIALSFGIAWLKNDVLIGLQLYTISMSIMQIISLGMSYHYAIKR